MPDSGTLLELASARDQAECCRDGLREVECAGQAVSAISPSVPMRFRGRIAPKGLHSGGG
jgi:hypothetical protein